VAITVSLYNHTAKLFADGSNAAGDTYKVMLCTAATFDATNTTLAGVTKTEVAGSFGYTTGGQALTSVTVTTTTTNDATFDAADAQWTASGGALTASKAIVYNDTDANDPPLALIDFGGSQSASDGNIFKLAWNASGIFTWTVA
jgi:hypothetical protein